MIRRFILFGVLFTVSAFGIDFKDYHSQEEINGYLHEVAQTYPQLAQFYNLGMSDEQREINYLTLTKGNTSLPGIYFNGTHHGNEWSSTESILALIDYLVGHRDDAEISALLSQYVIYLQPLVNPDGHFHQTREDVNGADPNRDYAFPGATPGSQFKTKIIPLVKKLLDGHHFRAAAAYHSGIEEVLWPWCYTSSPTKDKDLFYSLTKKVATAMHYTRYLQSYDDYATDGEFIDYAYMTQGTLALTYEVSSDFIPPKEALLSVVNRSIDGAMALMRAVRDYDHGRFAVEAAPQLSLSHRPNPLWVLFGTKLE